MAPQLPHELSDCIVDFLHNDSVALSACGLTCRAWLSAVRYHRFSVTRVYGRLAPFAELLAFSPDVAPFIRTFELQGFPYPHVRRYEPEDLLSVLDCLPSLRRLALISVELDTNLASALTENASFRRISGLGIRWCVAEHTMHAVRLLTTPALEHLEIDRLLSDLNDSHASIDLPTLKSLSIAGVQWTNHFSRCIVAGKHQIQSFQALVTWRAEAELVAETLSILGASLEHLDINIDAEGNLQAVLDDTGFSLEGLSHVRSCRLQFALREMFVAGNMSLPWINKLIIAQLSSPRLEKMALRIRADNVEDLRALDSECGAREVSVVRFDDLAILDWEGIYGAIGSRALNLAVEGHGDATRFLENISTRYPGLSGSVRSHHVR